MLVKEMTEKQSISSFESGATIMAFSCLRLTTTGATFNKLAATRVYCDV